MNVGRPVQSVQFSPDGHTFVFACGSMDDANAPFFAQVFDAGTGQPISERMEHGGAVFRAEFSPDGRWVLTASTDGTRPNDWEASHGNPGVRAHDS